MSGAGDFTPVDPGATSRSAVPRGQPSDAERADALRRVNHRGALRFGWLWEWAKVMLIAMALFLVVRAFLVEAYKIPSGSMERTLLVGDFLLVNKLMYGAEVPLVGGRLPALRAPQRGDVVVFQWPEDPTKNFVKRLVGLPGDTLAMRDGTLYVNGQPRRERYVTHTDPGVDPAFEDFRWQRDYVVRTAAALSRPAGAAGGASGASGASPAATPLALDDPSLRGTLRDPSDHPSRNNWGPLIVPQHSLFVLGDNRDNSLDSRYWGFVPDSLLRGRPMFVYYSYAPDAPHRFAWLSAIRWSRLGERVR